MVDYHKPSLSISQELYERFDKVVIIDNLLPLPALDGGHFVLLVLEAVRGKPLGARATNAIQMVGVAIILSITVLAVFNDISR